VYSFVNPIYLTPLNGAEIVPPVSGVMLYYVTGVNTLDLAAVSRATLALAGASVGLQAFVGPTFGQYDRVRQQAEEAEQEEQEDESALTIP